jgi:predicted Zn-dependent protease
MTFIGLKAVVISHLLLFCLVITGVFVLPCAAREGIVPERNIEVYSSDLVTPNWRAMWEKARNYARMEQYLDAALLYAELFKLKPNIEEANWEYCKILLKIGDYKVSSKVVASLFEKNPSKIDYLYVGGRIAAYNKDWGAAVKFFGKVLEKDPVGQFSEAAIEGLVVGLRGMGKKEIALPLAEHLAVRQPENYSLQQEMAIEAYKIGDITKTHRLLRRLLAGQQVNEEILAQVMKLFDNPGNDQEKVALAEQYLKKNPQYFPFRQRLLDHYLSKGHYEAALEHLNYLIDHMDDNDAYLLKAGELNLYQLGRPDKALALFERYCKRHPNNKEIKQRIANIQYVLANDFLSIIENDGAWLLWKDLAKVTPNRLAIYLKVAELLEEKGMIKEHLEILTIIHQHHPNDDAIIIRLAQTYYSLKQFDTAIGFLDKLLQKANKTKRYYVLRGKIEMELGREADALASNESALQLDVNDIEMRETCIALAGSLGYAQKLRALFEDNVKQIKQTRDSKIFLTYLNALSRNYMFVEYERAIKRYRPGFRYDRKTIEKIDLHYASTLRRQGKIRKAEQFLRQLLRQQRSVNEAVNMLVENALADKNIIAAKSWFGFLAHQMPSGKIEFSYDVEGFRKLLLMVKIAKFEGDFKTADDVVDRFLAGALNKLSDNDLAPWQADLAKERCWLSFYLGDYQSALNRLEKYFEIGRFDPEIFIFRRLLERKIKTQEKNLRLRNINLLTTNSLKPGHLFSQIESGFLFQEYEVIEQQIQAALQILPDSVLGKTLYAKLLLAQGRFDEAEKTLLKLSEMFPEESWFSKQLIEIETKRGNYSKGLELFVKNTQGMKGVDSLLQETSLSLDIEELLSLARLLWGDKQHEKALQLYRKLLTPSIREILVEKFREKQINHLYLTRRKSLWNSMLLLQHSDPEIIAEIMEPAFLIANFTNEAGKIVADNYELYSWQKLISTEYLARNAYFENNYYVAEESFKQLIDEQGTSEGMNDLARIYSRIGKYRKEAQIYEAIQSTGATSTELAKSMERSTLQLSPQNVFDFGYSVKDGRNNYIDITKISSGTSFLFTPDLDMDVRVVYANNRYKSTYPSQSTTSNLLNGSIVYEFNKNYEFSLGSGAEKFGDNGDARFLYKLSLAGQFDKYFHAYSEWGKRLVDDNVKALQEGISNQDIEVGVFCKTPVGFSIGTDFRHRSYSDNNIQNRLHGYTSFGLLGESLQASLRYDYQFFDNSESNSSESDMTETKSENVLEYWSPLSFSEHLLTLHLQHDFLGFQQGTKRGMSYYAIDNTIGYEDNETLSYTGKFDIFLEMSPHYLLKGNFTLAKSDVLEEKGLSLSLHYRW